MIDIDNLKSKKGGEWDKIKFIQEALSKLKYPEYCTGCQGINLNTTAKEISHIFQSISKFDSEFIRRKSNSADWGKALKNWIKEINEIELGERMVDFYNPDWDGIDSTEIKNKPLQYLAYEDSVNGIEKHLYQYLLVLLNYSPHYDKEITVEKIKHVGEGFALAYFLPIIEKELKQNEIWHSFIGKVNELDLTGTSSRLIDDFK